MSLSVTTMCVERHPATSAHYQVLPSDASHGVTPTQVVETRLAQFGLDLVPRMNELQVFHKTQKDKLTGRVRELTNSQGALQQQLITIQRQSERELAQRETRLTELETENKQLQDQMAELIAKQTEENQRLQKRLEDARKHNEQTLATNKASWDQSKQSLESQIQSIQTQVDTLQPNYDAVKNEITHLSNTNLSLNTQLTSLRTQEESLRKIVREELIREKAAVQANIEACKQTALNALDKEIGYFTQRANLEKTKLSGSIFGRTGYITTANETSVNPLTAAWVMKRVREQVQDMGKPPIWPS